MYIVSDSPNFGGKMLIRLIQHITIALIIIILAVEKVTKPIILDCAICEADQLKIKTIERII